MLNITDFHQIPGRNSEKLRSTVIERYLVRANEMVRELSTRAASAEISPKFVPDHTGESLVALEHWLKSQLKLVPWTLAEEQDYRDQMRDMVGLEVDTHGRKKVNREGVSLCVSAAMYVAQCLEKNLPQLGWWWVTKPKNSMNFGFCVLRGPGGMIQGGYNPVTIGMNLSMEIATRMDGVALLGNFEVWSFPRMIMLRDKAAIDMKIIATRDRFLSQAGQRC